jgi:tRNA/rRNA methyltransferase
MTEKDHTQLLEIKKAPIIILIEPQMGENIGGSARAMLNCGIKELRIVNPRDGWPNDKAIAMSSGAIDKMPEIKVFNSTHEAVSDLNFVLATTARLRDMSKGVYTASGAADEALKRINNEQDVGVLFGGERSGLSNEDIALSHAIITIPLNPEFSSLNLAQAVLLFSYEWSKLIDNTEEYQLQTGDSKPASHSELSELTARLEDELEKHHFFRNPEMRPSIMRNLKNMFGRADMTEQEIRTFHGIISALTGKKTPLK